MSIHPMALVSPHAQVHNGVEIGPFSIVEAGATLGQDCQIAANVVIKSGVTLGRECVVHENTVIGGLAQHTSPTEEPGNVIVGERCTLRENVTIHRPLHSVSETRLGNDCFLMAGAHVAHDCFVGNNVILTNNVLLGGHVHVGDRACLGGSVAVHQFCRIGRLAMIGGCARVVQDVPPFVLADGESALIVGLNRIGLRRAGFDRAQVKSLKEAYRLVYREGLPFDEMIAAVETQFAGTPAAEFAEFFSTGRRGFVQERRSPVRGAIRLHPAAEKESVEGRRMAG
ncbi:acyl-ACP--UDP-N-acetylglucosamine O-acyltransferase [Adhaeretor mobilis]|uniref:Acyl-[acyl-carrier-protein]--UDP-N-acetylglucosamine O-acyltransferase n=1 Tax=Adhaeretor mobilis TaxID=1930276 RepID=A0A517MSG4_9BACT|nr:acyl-ACP--UDP-N-acetylglucosamine O-acyltransferase [Adhaeretor mobilis]QDS97824.1 Acyl-[acyl-carrier-protein]--UDP-N-acetylglucosamine O-acyltransferase [Adhaeretor mobilis]